MNRNGWKRLIFVVAMLAAVVGITLGAVAGGVAGYLMASRAQEAEPVALLQPGDGTTLPEAPPAQGDGEEAPPASQPEPTPEPVEEIPATETPAPPAAAPATEPIVAAVQSVQPATVLVLTGAGSGSGVIVSEDGYVVTNNHVIEGSNQYVVVYDRGERVPARLVGAAPHFDLAVLQVEGEVPAVARWGDSSAVPLGGQVIAIGSALGSYQNSVTTGILSGVNRELGGLVGLLQHDAAINHGNSGGPLVNLNGEVVGINTMMVRGGSAEAEGLGFATPSNIAQAVTRQLIATGEAPRPAMGVMLLPLNSQVAQEYGLDVTEGALIQEVVAGSPSEAAGLRAGDVVTAVDGKAVNDRDTLQMHVLSHAAGETVTVSVVRSGEPMELDITLGRAG